MCTYLTHIMITSRNRHVEFENNDCYLIYIYKNNDLLINGEDIRFYFSTKLSLFSFEYFKS